MEGADKSSDEEIGDNTPPAANAQPQIKEPNPNPPRCYLLRNQVITFWKYMYMCTFLYSKEKGDVVFM